MTSKYICKTVQLFFITMSCDPMNRSDDGETWREHTLAYLQSRWEGGDDEIYQVRRK